VSTAEIIERMLEVVPPGSHRPPEGSLRRLEQLTQALIAAKPDAADEHTRFLSIRQRELCLPTEAITAWLEGANILVTGGTGCIGSRLMALAAGFRPGRLVSVSRGITTGWSAVEGADYRFADIRDRRAMDHLIGEIRPDVVFHVAAQRQPGLAETEVHRSVSTNVCGTRNVLGSAAEAGVSRFVYASTGKALRPYSPEIYAASKRVAEWAASEVAASGEMLCSAARFTHVSDNSIIYRRLLSWAEGGVIRLHGPHIGFYVQSALESAQLLLLAGLGTERHELRIHAITNLGWPVNLLDVALGVLETTGSATPIYFSGYDPGYEEVSFPGLYDPKTAGEVSPLLNAFEAGATVPPPCPMLDTFRLEAVPDPAADKLLDALEEVCAQTTDPDAVRGALGELSWALLDATLSAASPEALMRAAMAAERHDHSLAGEYRRLLQALKEHADAARTA
jgi:nucleoside-diphosphate-sugar epimerase